MRNSYKKFGLLIIILLNIGCDQISKDIVREKVAPSEYIQLLKDNLILTNVENTGAMLGVGQNLPEPLKIIFLQILPVIVLGMLLYFILIKVKMNKWNAIAFAFVIGGGIGNIIDRILYGSVTDFFHINIGFFKTGVFNMADVSVTFGAIFILLFSFLKRDKILIH